MSSPNDVTRSAESGLELVAGQQVVVATGTGDSALGRLPLEGDDVALVVTSDSPDDVASALDRTDVALGNVGVIPVAGSRVAYDGPMAVCERVVPDDLTGLSMRYSEAIEGMNARSGSVVFDRLNVLLTYAAEDRVLRFLDHAANRARGRGLGGLYCVTGNALDDRTYAKLKRRVDEEVDLR